MMRTSRVLQGYLVRVSLNGPYDATPMPSARLTFACVSANVGQIEYEEEGIPWSHVEFSDNAEVLGLVESRMGIIAVLNEECVRPRGGDLSFVNKVRQH